MSEKVYLLIGSDNYYPGHDNTVRVFRNRDDAEQVCSDLNEIGGPTHKEQYEELCKKYGWLPEYRREVYTVEEYAVHD